MEGVRPCPYCGGEVEVIKLKPNVDEKAKKVQPYRIQCYRCHAVVARGQKFPIETIANGKERIEQYNDYIAKIWEPRKSNKIVQSESAKERDRRAARASRIDKDDEVMELHDISHPYGHLSKGVFGNY